MKKWLSMFIISALGLALLVYSAMRGLDFVRSTLPPAQQILAFFALAATEGGVIAWLVYFLFAASGAPQRAIAGCMVVIDFLGAAALFTADTLLRSGEAGMIEALAANEIRGVILALSGLIALNVAATLASHVFDPDNRRKMAEEEARDKVHEATLKQISERAEELAGELAPQLAGSWYTNTREGYLAGDLGEGYKGAARKGKRAQAREPELTPDAIAEALAALKQEKRREPELTPEAIAAALALLKAEGKSNGGGVQIPFLSKGR